jgi:hypothetical protein
MGVSSKNELAIIETDSRACCSAAGTLSRVPALRGTPRQLAENVTAADWAADGERLVVSRHGQCAFLNGSIIATACGMPRLSPVGDDVAFISSGGLTIQTADGKRLKSQLPFVFGLAWSPDGREVWFTGSETFSAHDRALYAIGLDGQQRLIARAPGAMTVYDVSRDGQSALIATGAGWYGINGSMPNGGERVLDLNGRTRIAGLSNDGAWLLLSEEREVGTGTWLRSADGKLTQPLSSDAARGLTPDGKWALIQRLGDPTRLVLQPVGPGEPRDVPVPDRLEASPRDWHAAWSDDGQRLFLPLNRVGGTLSTKQIYVREGEASWRPVTPEGVSGPFAVSPDGEVVAANDNSGVVTLYRIEGGPPRPVEGEHGRPVHWTAAGRLLLADLDSLPARLYHRDLATGRTEPWRTIAPADPTGVMTIIQVIVDRNERTYVYQYGRGLNDLFLVRDLR